MPPHFRARLCSLVFLAGACASAMAQDDAAPLTVSSAQLYLSIVVPGMEYKPASLQNAVRAAVQGAGGTIEIDGFPTIQSVAVLAPCISTFTFLYPSNTVYRHTTGGVINEVPLSALPQLQGLQGDTRGSNWNEVISVTRQQQLVEIRYSNTGFASTLNARNHATAARIVQAIELLRVACRR